jgi:predicted O-linked N-acetylglucosamine transferase (SPINDLY family)
LPDTGSKPVPQDLDQALHLHREGRLADAERAYRSILRERPQDFEALHLLGALKLQQEEPREALGLIEAALEIDQGSASTHSNRGLALAALKRPEAALASFDQALALDPGSADALASRADVLCDLARTDEALEDYDRALAIKPRLPFALINRGLALHGRGRDEEALASYEAALAIDPGNAEALNNRGVVLQELGRCREALASYERALAARPRYTEALFNRGNALLALRRPSEALLSHAALLAINPGLAEAHCGRGHAFADLRRFEEALASYEAALRLRPDYADAAIQRAAMLAKLDRHAEAIVEYEKLAATGAAPSKFLKDIVHGYTAVCQWSKSEKLIPQLIEAALEGSAPVDPFMLLGVDCGPEQHLKCAMNWLRHKRIEERARNWNPRNFAADKLRIAYLSADYHRHATAHLIAELFELHDRNRFEIIGISFGPNERSELRSRLIRSFDRFFEVTTRTDAEAADLIRDLNCHIAVDLKGHTTDARIGILAQRPAPIQVSYLGYPGSCGAKFMDYIIADRVVLPLDQQPFYPEAIVHLPDSYQVNDRKRPVGDPPKRSELGLPDDAFVFCCFNNSWKLNRTMFEIWMRLLDGVKESVLWLFAPNSAVAENLRGEAAACRIDPSRLVFAPPLDMPAHLARVALADLFLDTLPYNAHTTASDALWMGVPVVTCTGRAFAGRVGASLLHAAGLPELITRDLDEFEAVARRLATEPELLASLVSRLKDGRAECALFDTDRFRRHIESAYATMWTIWQGGQAPRAFSVEAIPT